MTPAFGVDCLTDLVQRQLHPLPAQRKARPNTRYRLADAARGALGLFFTPSPSFLADHRRLAHRRGHKNARPLVGSTQIPCDNHLRTRLDPSAPRVLEGIFLEVCEALAAHRLCSRLRVLADQLFVALDGPPSFASTVGHGPNGLRRQLHPGQTRSDQAAIPPVIVGPGPSQVGAVPPQYRMPPAGQEKQAGARQAGTRWLAHHAQPIAPHGVPLLGDALSSNQPFCERVWAQGCNVLLTCTADAHATRAERWAFWQASDASAEPAVRPRHRGSAQGTRRRSRNDVLRRSGDGAVSVHWCAMTVVQAKTGEQLSHQSWIPHHRLTPDNVSDMAPAGRARWKVDNEHNQVLTTKGDHLEHNFGPGKQDLSAVMRRLNLLACLCQTVLAGSDDQDALLRPVLARRQSFFQDIQALMRSMVFDDWHHLMDCMMRGLALESHFDTSWSLKLELLEYTRRLCAHFALTPWKIPENKDIDAVVAFAHTGSLFLFARGYFKIKALALIAAAGAYFWTRLNHQANLLAEMHGHHSPWDLVSLLKTIEGSIIEKQIYMGTTDLVAARLIASRVPDNVVNARRRAAKKKAKTKGYTPSKAHLALLAWHLFITHVPSTRWSSVTVVKAYAIRWQVELSFQSWQRSCHLATLQAKKAETVLCYLYGRMRLILINDALYPQVRCALWVQKHRELSLLKLVRHFQALADIWMQVLFQSELALRRFLQQAGASAERLAAKASRKRRTTAQRLRESLQQQLGSVEVAAAVNA